MMTARVHLAGAHVFAGLHLVGVLDGVKVLMLAAMESKASRMRTACGPWS